MRQLYRHQMYQHLYININRYCRLMKYAKLFTSWSWKLEKIKNIERIYIIEETQQLKVLLNNIHKIILSYSLISGAHYFFMRTLSSSQCPRRIRLNHRNRKIDAEWQSCFTMFLQPGIERGVQEMDRIHARFFWIVSFNNFNKTHLNTLYYNTLNNIYLLSLILMKISIWYFSTSCTRTPEVASLWNTIFNFYSFISMVKVQ